MSYLALISFFTTVETVIVRERIDNCNGMTCSAKRPICAQKYHKSGKKPKCLSPREIFMLGLPIQYDYFEKKMLKRIAFARTFEYKMIHGWKRNNNLWRRSGMSIVIDINQRTRGKLVAIMSNTKIYIWKFPGTGWFSNWCCVYGLVFSLEEQASHGSRDRE